MKTLLTPLLLILFTLASYASDLPPCPKGTYHNCFGTFTYASGAKYVGEYKDDKKHGKGTFTWANGDRYEGEYKDGKKHGKGTYTYGSGKVKSGIWADDEYLYDLAEHQKREKRRLTLLRQKEKQKKEAQSRREESRLRASCAMDAGKAGTEYAAKQIEKTCLEDLGLKPKGWFDW